MRRILAPTGNRCSRRTSRASLLLVAVATLPVTFACSRGPHVPQGPPPLPQSIPTSVLDAYCGQLYKENGAYLDTRTDVHLLNQTEWINGLRYFARNPEVVAETEVALKQDLRPRPITIDPSTLNDTRCMWVLTAPQDVRDVPRRRIYLRVTNPFENPLESIPWERRGLLAEDWVTGQAEGRTGYWIVLEKKPSGGWTATVHKLWEVSS